AYYRHSIWVSTGRGDPKYGDFVPLVEDLGPGTNETWEEVRLALADYADQPIYLAFRYEGDFDDEWYVDDVEVTAGLYALNDGPKGPGEAVTLWAGVGSGTNIRYTWSFGDGTSGTGQVVTHTYAAAGVYTAVVTLSNSINTVTTTTVVRIQHRVYLPLVLRTYTPPCFDAYEPDDTVDQATAIPVDGTPQRHNFHEAGDVDWIAFEVPDPSVDYLVETFDLNDTDTVIYLYDSDGERLLDWNDDAAPGVAASRLTFDPYHAGTFYVKIVQYDPSTGGCDQAYSVRVTAQIGGRSFHWE
ncbi:MAG TPA: PKD domain-containing protein, partial [Anaerolineae bacterium]|nr:PKD domain-containing protein [Anaerolineae bacterium]